LHSTVLYFITHRSTGRQKQARFLPVGKLLAKEHHHFKINSFFAFAAFELSRYSPLLRSIFLTEKTHGNFLNRVRHTYFKTLFYLTDKANGISC